jgi:hypothetical protein
MRFSLAARTAPFLAAFAAAAAASQAAASPMLLERILAVVDGRPVLLSEARLVQQVTGRDPAQALEALIDERLMFREAARLPQAAVSEDETTRALASLRQRVGAAAEGVPEIELRPMAHRQAAIVKYVAFRFEPQVRVDEDAVRRAYDQAWSGHTGAPAFEHAAPELRRRLREQELNQRIEAWVRELRAAAEIRYNPTEAPEGAAPAS